MKQATLTILIAILPALLMGQSGTEGNSKFNQRVVKLTLVDGDEETFTQRTSRKKGIGGPVLIGMTKYGEFRTPINEISKVSFNHQGIPRKCPTTGYFIFSARSDSPFTGEEMEAVSAGSFMLYPVHPKDVEGYSVK